MLDSKLAKVKLDEVLKERMGTAARVAQQVLTTVPQDSIVKASAIHFEPKDDHSLVMSAGDQSWGLHHHALRQVGDRTGVPAVYADRLLSGESWQVEMLAEVFNKTFAHSMDRHLIRAVGEAGKPAPTALAVLSDRFRRLDSRPIIEGVFEAAQKHGGVPLSGTASMTRYAIKMVKPVVYEPIPGEHVVFGLDWSNSDYGNGKHAIRSFLLRLICLNGATAEDLLSQIHLGGRLADSIEFSKRTYELDTEATVSAAKDVVTSGLSDEHIEGLMARVRAANEKEVDWSGIKGRLGKVLTKDEVRRVDEAFKGPDVINLPPGETAWRASNALSWIANTLDDDQRKLEFEKIAGGLIAGKVEAPAAIEEAA
jgi:hypothetical protein